MKQHAVYQIRNVVNDDFYIGGTSNPKERFRTHRIKLRNGNHHCSKLQSEWNHYGEECFKFEVIMVVDSMDNLNKAENALLAKHVGKPHCYNTGYTADSPWRGAPKEQHPNFGVARTPYTKEQISIALKEYYAKAPENHPRYGKHHTEETKARISESRTGKMAGANHYRYGQTLSDEVRAKIGDTQRGVPKAPRTISAEGMAKIRASAAAGNYSHFQGKTHTEEAKAKMSRRIEAVSPTGEVTAYPSITALREATGLKPPTVNRALQSGNPVAKGLHQGWSFRYA